MLQPKKKKARNSINGNPQWEMMDAPAVIGEELTMKLCGLANVVGEDDLTALGAAKNAGFAAHIDSCAEDGGGWSLACSKAGEVSTVTGDVSWIFGCKCRHSLNCPAKCRGGRSQRGDVPQDRKLSLICRCRIRRCEKFVICAGSNLGGE